MKGMPMLSRTLELSRMYLTSPSKGARSIEADPSWEANLGLYGAFIILSLIFYWLKPWDFPAPAEAASTPHGLWFWSKVMLWQPPLEAAWIFFLLGLAAFFKEGSFPKRLLAALVWSGGLFAVMVTYVQSAAFSRAVFAAVELLLFLPFAALWGRRDGRWRAVCAFMVGANVIGAVLILPMALTVWARSQTAFEMVQALGGLWMMTASALGLRQLTQLRLSRAFLAVVISLVFQIFVAFILFLSGAVSKEILKALLYA